MISKIDNIITSNGLEKYFSKRYFNQMLILFLGLLGLYLNWSFKEITVVSFLVWHLLMPISSQYLARITVFGFVSAPLMIVFGRPERADTFAELSFLFFAITISTLIYENHLGEKK